MFYVPDLEQAISLTQLKKSGSIIRTAVFLDCHSEPHFSSLLTWLAINNIGSVSYGFMSLTRNSLQ